jgi:hypothetical protein
MLGQLSVALFEQGIVKGDGAVLAGVERLGAARRLRAMMAALGRAS